MRVAPAIRRYIVDIVEATRRHSDMYLGASPRASINLILTARALAYVRGREYVLPQDVIDMAHDVMRHRLVLSFEALSDNVSPDQILSSIVSRIPVPVVPLQDHNGVRVGA